MKPITLSTALSLVLGSITILAAPSGNGNSNIDTTDQLTTPNTIANNANSLAPLLGLNCRGSIMCGCQDIRNIIHYIDQIPDDKTYKNGQQIVCVECTIMGGEAVCVWPEKLKKGETVSGKVVKEKVHRIQKHGCTSCGGCPVHPGNNIDTGVIKIDYTANGCLYAHICSELE